MASELRDGEWRRKSVERFSDDDLVALRYEFGGHEVWLYHERICDRIDIAHENATTVSLFVLAREVHDDPPVGDEQAFGEWADERLALLRGLEDAGRICIDGELSPYSKIRFSLPDDVYEKWHRRGRNRHQPKDEKGRFVPAHTVKTRNGSVTVPKTENTDSVKPVETETEKEAANAANAHVGARGGGDPLDHAIDLIEPYDKNTRGNLRVWIEGQMFAGKVWTPDEVLDGALEVARKIEEGEPYKTVRGFLVAVIDRQRRERNPIQGRKMPGTAKAWTVARAVEEQGIRLYTDEGVA